jgi:hypothetical protein
MAKFDDDDDGGDVPQDIEALKKRHRELEKDKHTAEANQRTAEEQLKRLKAEAREKYGTDDLEELKRKLAEMKQQNLTRRREYQGHLDQIEAKLGEIEQKYAGQG